jgi:hypothetical protein
VVVIYRTDGTVVKRYSLAELLSKKVVRKLPRSVSSIWWGGEHRLDDQRQEVVLAIVAEGRSFLQQDAKYSELRLALASGEKLANGTPAK